MKQAIKILALLLLSTIAQAQTTEPVFNTKSSWIEVRTNLMDSTIFEITTYKIDGDTLINGKKYSKVFANDIFWGVGLRETEDHKIYTYVPGFGRELLLYDFDWYPGKILYYQIIGFPDEFFILAIIGDVIDSIQLLDGNYYQCLKYNNEAPWLIRGLGTMYGFFTHTEVSPPNGDQHALLCFYIDDQLVYNNPKYNYCFFVPVTEIINVPAMAIAGTPLALSGTVVPNNATYQNIIWSVYDEGNTGAVISTIGENHTLNTIYSGNVVVTATVHYDLYGSAYTQNFTIEVKSGAGVNEPVQSSNIRVYPNPAKDYLHIKTKQQFEIIDMQGRVLLKSEKTTKSININQLKAGIYFIKFEDGRVEKFVKE